MSSKPNNKSKVYILIAVKDRWENTNVCLNSIYCQTYKNIQVVVIDDGSKDHTSTLIAKNYPKTKLIRGNGDYWWGGAMNKGIEYSLDNSDSENDFILFVNNDTYFDRGYIAKLVNMSQVNGNITVGSVSVEGDTGKVISITHKLINGEFVQTKTGYPTKGLTYDTDTLCGRGTLIPINVVRKVGQISRWFPHYHGDYDYFFRVKKSRNLISINLDSFVYLQNDGMGLADSIKQKGIMNFADFLELFFSRRSYSNMSSRLLLCFLHIPFPIKLIMLSKIGTYPFYILFTKVRKLK